MTESATDILAQPGPAQPFDPVLSRGELVQRLRAAFARGQLRPGERLPTDREVAQRTGLARSTVREAMGELVREGWIVRQVGRGSFVADRTGPAVAAAALPMPADLMELRILLEPALAERIVMKATDAELETLDEIVAQGREVADWRAAELNDSRFHRQLFRLCRNPSLERVAELIDEVRGSLSWQRLKRSGFSLESWQVYLAEHAAIAKALAERDAQAARDHLLAHLSGVRVRMLD